MNMSETTRELTRKAHLSEFDSLANPNHDLARKALSFLVPIAFAGIILLIISALMGSISLVSVFVALVFVLIGISGVSKDPGEYL